MATEGEFHTATTFLGIRWSIEANLGIGYARLHYDKYKCQKCGEKSEQKAEIISVLRKREYH